jgi:bifunctional non-homologous end joining protein LigD
VSVYSLRARPTATVSTPVTWDEVGEAAEGAPLSFTQADVLARIPDGDLFQPLLTTTRPALPKV